MVPNPPIAQRSPSKFAQLLQRTKREITIPPALNLPRVSAAMREKYLENAQWGIFLKGVNQILNGEKLKIEDRMILYT